jgi:organic hydroperoxide reductase OsmC/OhrA
MSDSGGSQRTIAPEQLFAASVAASCLEKRRASKSVFVNKNEEVIYRNRGKTVVES